MRVLLAWLAGVSTAHVLASFSQSVFVMAALERAGAEFSLATRLHVIGHDVVGLLFSGVISFGGALLLAFAIVVPLAAAAVHYLRTPGWVAYPLAGAVAVASILAIIQINFFYHMTLMEGTRGPLGYGSQLLAGALGGAVFWLCRRSRWLG